MKKAKLFYQPGGQGFWYWIEGYMVIIYPNGWCEEIQDCRADNTIFWTKPFWRGFKWDMTQEEAIERMKHYNKSKGLEDPWYLGEI